MKRKKRSARKKNGSATHGHRREDTEYSELKKKTYSGICPQTNKGGEVETECVVAVASAAVKSDKRGRAGSTTCKPPKKGTRRNHRARRRRSRTARKTQVERRLQQGEKMEQQKSFLLMQRTPAEARDDRGVGGQEGANAVEETGVNDVAVSASAGVATNAATTMDASVGDDSSSTGRGAPAPLASRTSLPLRMAGAAGYSAPAGAEKVGNKGTDGEVTATGAIKAPPSAPESASPPLLKDADGDKGKGGKKGNARRRAEGGSSAESTLDGCTGDEVAGKSGRSALLQPPSAVRRDGVPALLPLRRP